MLPPRPPRPDEATRRPLGVPRRQLEPGESWLEAARRELREELGVSVLAAGEPVFRLRDPASSFEIVFVDVEIEGEPEALEHEEVRWVTASEMKDLDLAPADAAFGLGLRSTEKGRS